MQKTPKIRTNVNLVPVGFVSDAIAHISQQPGDAGFTFNILNPYKLTLQEIIKEIKRKGYPIKLVSFKQWRNELLKSGASENPRRKLASLFVLDENDERSIVRRYSDLQPRYDKQYRQLTTLLFHDFFVFLVGILVASPLSLFQKIHNT